MTEPKRFNKYILDSVEYLATNRAGLGYDIHSFFTKTLDYGGTGSIPANHPPKTMCVAAVCEVIVEALNIWQKDNTSADGQPDRTPFLELPLKSWTGGTRADIRPYVFMYDGVKSRGTADALSRFGIGRETSFEQLQPGDFINFNRTKSGHSVVFLSYIDRKYDDVAYSADVVGFKYFSAQGQAVTAPNHGFGYRWGIFGNNVPPPPPGKIPDPGIQKSDHLSILDCGFMFDPADWSVATALTDLQNSFRTEIENEHNLGRNSPIGSQYSRPDLNQTVLRELSRTLFNEELKDPDWSFFDDSRG
jgi:hypothetical protein